MEQAIKQALQTLLQTLHITPSGQAEVPALQHRLFQVIAPRSGFNITLPHRFPRGDPFMLPVTPDVRWEVLHEDGEPLSPGDGFIADPPSLNSHKEQLLFFPQLVKDEPDTPGSIAFTLRASVCLTSTHPTTGEAITVPATERAALPTVTVTVPVALRIPSILALFPHNSLDPQAMDKDGFALVFVEPGSSVRRMEDLADSGALGIFIQEVGALRADIEKLPVSEQSILATLAGNLEGFLDGLSSLISSLARFGSPTASPIAIRLERINSDLNMEELIPGFLSSMEGENEISSLIYIGLKETVRLYNRGKYHAEQRILQIETGAQMCAVVDRLDRAMPPATIGDPTITMLDPANFAPEHPDRSDTSDNAIVSFQFGRTSPS